MARHDETNLVVHFGNEGNGNISFELEIDAPAGIETQDLDRFWLVSGLEHDTVIPIHSDDWLEVITC